MRDQMATSFHWNKVLRTTFCIALMAVGLYGTAALASAQSGAPYDPRNIQARQAWASASAELRAAEARVAQDASNRQSQHGLAVILDRLGDIQHLQGQKDASYYPYDAGYQHAHLLARNDVKMNPHSPLMDTVKRIKLTTYKDDEAHAWAFRDAARSYYRAAHRIHQDLASLDPGNDEWQRALALSYIKKGPGLLSAKNRLADYQAALVILLRLTQDNPANTDWQRDLATLYGKMGDAMASTQAKVPAEYHEELAIRTKLFRKDETNALWTRELAMTFDKIGNALNYLAKLDAARDAYTDGQGLHEDLVRLDPANTQWQSDLATVYVEIGDLESRRRATFQKQALAAYQNALKIRTQLLELDPGNIQWQVNLVESHRKLASFYGNSAEHARVLETNIIAQQQMAHFAQRYPHDRGWLFYQLEFYFDIGAEHLRVQRDTRPRIASDQARFPPDPERFEAAKLAGEATFKKMVEIIEVLARQDDASTQQ